jgi:hypothetical protein
MRAAIDRALFAVITRGWSGTAIDGYSDALATHRSATPAHVDSAFQTLDAKATGLLTHVSMMIAGLGIVAPLVAQSRVEEAIVILEIAVYLVIAVACLRCLSVFGPRDLGPDAAAIKQNLGRELILRQELYRLSNRFSIVFSILVFITLPVLLAWSH